MAKHTYEDLIQMQSLPLDAKVRMTMQRIKGWIDEYGEDAVSVSFSGGKDSTVLMDIIRNKMGLKNIPAVFVDVPTQFPELKSFALTWDNVIVLRPKTSFMDVCQKYGFPLVSKEASEDVSQARKWMKKNNVSSIEQLEEIPLQDIPHRLASLLGKYEVDWGKKKKSGNFDGNLAKSFLQQEKWKFLLEADFEVSPMCCNVMKKKPIHEYEKETGRKQITAIMADESRLRLQNWLNHGCNGFDMKSPVSNPMSFWTEQDILRYIKSENLPICSVYGEVVIDYEAMGELEGQTFLFNTGDEPLKTTGCKRTGCMLCGFGCHLEKSPNRFEKLKETHPKMYNLLDICKNNGVTFREAIEWTNEHGNLNIRL